MLRLVRRLLLLTCALGCLLPACVWALPPLPPGKEVGLLIWEVPPSWRRDPEGKAARRIFEAFLAKYPSIHVFEGPGVGKAGLQLRSMPGESSFLLAMAGGMAPDVFSVALRTVPGYRRQGFLHPIDGFWESWPDRQRLRPELIAAAEADGHVWGVPSEGLVLGLLYRKDLFAEAGLDPDRPPRDWDELYAYAQALTFPEKGQYGLALMTPGTTGGPPELPGVIFTTLLWQAGGELVRRLDGDRYEAVYNGPEGIVALDFIKKLRWSKWTRCAECSGAPFDITDEMLERGEAVCPRCKARYDIAQLRREGRLYEGVLLTYFTTGTGFGTGDFARGRVAMIVGTPEVDKRYLSEAMPIYKIGVAALPAGPAGRAAMMRGALHCINGTIRDPAKLEAAWKYVSFFHSREADRIRTQTFVEDGYGELVRPDLLAEFGYDWVLEGETERERELYDRLYEGARMQDSFPNARALETVHLRQVTDAVLLQPVDPEAVLDASVRSVNEELFHLRTEEEAARQRAAARVVFSVAALLAALGFTRAVVLLLQAAKARSSAERKVPLSRQVMAWCFMLPALVSILVWQYYPLARGSLMAFQDYYLVRPSVWVGLQNFIDVFSTRLFWRAWANTLFYVGLSLGMGFCLPIIVALLLAEVPRGKLVYRMIFLLPATTAGLVIMMMWWWFYDPTSSGLFNTILRALHLPEQQWLNDPKLAMVCVVLPGVWAGAGPGSIIYLAMMKSIPESLYEAADVDGAGVLHKIRYITLPTLKALIIMNFVGAFIGAFHAAQNILVMTAGGPQNATYVMGLHIFYNAFLYLRFGQATALAWVMGSMLIGFTICQLSVLRNVEFKTAR